MLSCSNFGSAEMNKLHRKLQELGLTQHEMRGFKKALTLGNYLSDINDISQERLSAIFKHEVELELEDDWYVNEWCSANTVGFWMLVYGNFSYDRQSYLFTDENDAMMFKLTFG
jgi:hypothetical protein